MDPKDFEKALALAHEWEDCGIPGEFEQNLRLLARALLDLQHRHGKLAREFDAYRGYST